MWSARFSTHTKASPAAIWKLWSNVETWTDWDPEISYCKLEGDFQEGVKGYLKPKEGPVTKFVLTSVEPMKGFSDRSILPFATLDFMHTLESRDGVTFIDHRVEMKGPLTFIFKRIIGAQIEKGLPRAVERLIQIAEKSENK